LHEKTGTLKQHIDKMKTAVSSLGEVIGQYFGKSIPEEIKEELDKQKEQCHGEIKEALDKCFFGTEDGTAGYYYTNLMKESNNIETQTNREIWINKYAPLLQSEADKMEKIMKAFRSIVSKKIEGHKSSSSSSESDISDSDLDDENFGDTFDRETKEHS